MTNNSNTPIEGNCPKWDECDKGKCRAEKVCMNANFWTNYWGNQGTAERMANNMISKSVGQKPGFKQSGGKCFYCEKALSNVDPPTRDHIIPLSKGGINQAKNIVKACNGCNYMKASMLPEEFAEYIGNQINNCEPGPYKQTLITILYNTRELVRKIEPYRVMLFKHRVQENKEAPAVIESPPPPPKIEVALVPEPKAKTAPADMLAKFKKKYPYIYGLMEEANSDLPRWAIDNIPKITI